MLSMLRNTRQLKRKIKQSIKNCPGLCTLKVTQNLKLYTIVKELLITTAYQMVSLIVGFAKAEIAVFLSVDVGKFIVVSYAPLKCLKIPTLNKA